MIASQCYLSLLAGGLLSSATGLSFGDSSPNPGSNSFCRALPGDADWPKLEHWQAFNESVGGRLLEAVPPGSVCHDAPYDQYDAEACAELKATFNHTSLAKMETAAEFMSMTFQNHSCDPFTPRSQPCVLGNYASYVLDLRDDGDGGAVRDVQKALSFIEKNDIRLVIKNTGHDYIGRSTGAGALTLWTHHLNATEYIPAYTAPYYSGPAMRLGAGVPSFAAYAAAHATGHRVVGGGCPTVGVAGGFAQGGGESVLASQHGLGADNVLEWEVVTAAGAHLVATPRRHADLYWALSGGGPGNYAVVLSMTARIHRDGVVGGGRLAFDDSHVGNDGFWDAIGGFMALLPPFNDAGNSMIYGVTPGAFTTYAITMPGAGADASRMLMKPFLDDLESRGIEYSYEPYVSPDFMGHFSRALGPLPEGAFPYRPFVSSRLVPRAVVADAHANARLVAALRNVSRAANYTVAYQTISVGRADQPHPANAVPQAWRDAVVLCVPLGDWDPLAAPEQVEARQRFAVDGIQAVLDAATPGAGVYMNEVSHLLPNWQSALYGANYEALLAVKQKYDPDSLLYVHHGVGSDAWVEQADKRLCRASRWAEDEL